MASQATTWHWCLASGGVQNGTNGCQLTSGDVANYVTTSLHVSDSLRPFLWQQEKGLSIWSCVNCYLVSVWARRVGNNSPLASISPFSTNRKRIQTPHTLFGDFWPDKTFTTHWSGDRVQVWVEPLLVIWQSLPSPEDLSRSQSKVLIAKSIAKLFWPRCSCNAAQLGRLGRATRESTNIGSSRVGCSRWGQRQAG